MLYERDYTRGLTDEEQHQVDEIDNKDKNKRKFGRINRDREKPKAYRHNNSLFPNYYMDYADLKNEELLTKEVNDLEKLLEKDKVTESELQALIKDNRYWHIIASIIPELAQGFGHHDLYLFPEFQLGTEYRADYLLIGSGSGGYEFVFAELEGATRPSTRKSGHLSDLFNEGKRQLEDWEEYLNAHFSTLSCQFQKNSLKERLPREFYEYDPYRFHYVVIAGRRIDFNDKTYHSRMKLLKEKNIYIIHYDNLLDYTKELIGRKTY